MQGSKFKKSTFYIIKIQIMLGPHYQRLAEAERQITGKQMLQRINARSDNPLTAIIDKLKRQFTEYETAYTEDICNHQISSVDRLLSFDGKLGPILASIQKQNNLLRRELSLLQSQLSNSVSICEQIISQNNQLKQALIQKNEDITKIIETIAKHESDSRNQLQDRVALLEQQNSILIQHLQEIKKKHQQYRKSFQSKDEEVNKWERKWSETKKHLSEAIERERQVTRKLAVSQHMLFENKQKLDVIQNQFYNSELQKAELQRQLSVFEGTRDSFDPQTLKRTLQNQYMQIIEQHRAMKNERQAFTKDIEKAKGQKQRLQQALIQIEKKFNKVLNQYEMTNSLLLEQKNKNATLVSTLKKLEIKIDEYKNENIQLKVEIESGKSLIFHKQKTLNSEIGDLRKQLDQRSSHSVKTLKEIQMKNQQLLDAKDIEIKRLTDENVQFRRLAERKA